MTAGRPPRGRTADRAAVYAYVDAYAERFVDRLCELVRQPSQVGHLAEQEACAGVLARLARESGWTPEVVKVDAFAPVVLARHPGAGPRRLVLYSHYDVVPTGPEDAWSVPPFSAARRGDQIIGRGTTDAKGNLLALVFAAEALAAVHGRPPCDLVLVADGEEEQGSPNLEAFLDQSRPALAADAVLSFDGAIDPSGVPKVGLGTSGMVYLELEVTTAARDLHAAGGRLYPNAAWRLIWALASLKGPDERVLIDGFDADVAPPTAADRALLLALHWDDTLQLREAGLDGFVLGLRGTVALERLLFAPAVTVCGLTAGYEGPGMLSIVPHRARAKLEFRIVADQTPGRVLDLVRAHLARHGFGDVRVSVLATVDAAKTDPDSAIVHAVKAAADELYGPPIVKPTEEYAGRQGVWLGNRLGVPGVGTGIGPPGHRGHAPDEFVTVEHFIRGVKFAAGIIDHYGQS